MTADPTSPVNIRVAFPTPYTEKAEFLIRLDRSRHTEGQIAACLQGGWLYEHFTSWVMTGLLRPGDVAVDVGAHVGYYTLLMRTLVGDTGFVYAAEPLPQSYSALTNNILINGYSNVVCAALAIADRNGRAPFELDSRNEGESHLAAAAAGGAPGDSTLMVETATLDAWLGDLECAPRLLKIDAEGCEARILSGGKSFFRSLLPDAVVCEINPPALQRFGADEMSLRSDFAALGYNSYLINVANDGPYDLCQGAILRPFSADERVTVNVVHNLLFCRPGVVPSGLGI